MSNNQTNLIFISGKCTDENRVINCFGKIEIRKIDDVHKVGYDSWQIFDENNVGLVGVTRNYYFGEVNNPQEEILKMILIDIQKYRMNRRKVFSEIKINE